MMKKRSPKNQGFSQGLGFAVFIMCIAITIITLILNLFLNEALFIQGINFIYNYQQAQPYPIIMFIQNVFSFLCNPKGLAIIVLFYYIIVNRKLLLIVHLSYFFTGIYFMAVLKQIFQQSRPIWYDDRIENWQWFCPKDFGNPSGHSFATPLFYEPLFTDVIGFGALYFGWIFLFLITIMIPVSRMYLGVHSANQILIGLTFGFAFLIAYRYFYQKVLYEFFWDLLVKTKNRIRIALIVLLNVIVIIIPIIFYEINAKERPMAEKDINNLNLRCGTSMTGAQVQEHILLACCIGNIAFGLCYGFLALSRKPGYKKYLLGMWQHASCKDIFLKILIYVLCCFFPALIFLAIGKFLIHVSVISYLFCCIGVLLAGFGLSYWAPLVSLKYNIIRLIPESQSDYESEQ